MFKASKTAVEVTLQGRSGQTVPTYRQSWAQGPTGPGQGLVGRNNSYSIEQTVSPDPQRSLLHEEAIELPDGTLTLWLEQGPRRYIMRPTYVVVTRWDPLFGAPLTADDLDYRVHEFGSRRAAERCLEHIRAHPEGYRLEDQL